jgi:hypothetical protein
VPNGPNLDVYDDDDDNDDDDDPFVSLYCVSLPGFYCLVVSEF